MFGRFIKSFKVGAVEAKTINILRRTFRVKPTDQVKQQLHFCMNMVEYYNEVEMATYTLGYLIDDIEIINERSTNLVSYWVSTAHQLIDRGYIDMDLNSSCVSDLFEKAKNRFDID